MAQRPAGEPSRREAGLRWLATGGRDEFEDTIQQALRHPAVPAKPAKRSQDLQTLVAGVASSMPAGTRPEQRAKALRLLIEDELALTVTDNERTALEAALHLDPTNTQPTIDQRLIFARDRGDFGLRSNGRPYGYDALRHWWGGGIRRLGHAVDERLDFLNDHPDEWLAYFTYETDDKPHYRTPSMEAQPVFLDLFVTTVFMQGRAVHRRITERVVTAQEDNVSYYLARALPESAKEMRVLPIWGCTAEHLQYPPGEPALTRLWFPTPLRRGQKHYFSSEVVSHSPTGQRRWVNVEVDHHGIAPGLLAHEDRFPISGLTIRISFQEGHHPAAVWWYADAAERVRYIRPPAGDPRWLAVTSQGCVSHTFRAPCQPQSNYGISMAWPVS